MKAEVKQPNFKVGDNVKVLKQIHGHCFKIGEIVEIEEIKVINTDNQILELKCCLLDGSDYWYLSEDEVELFIEKN
jgi:hypothetical protein